MQEHSPAVDACIAQAPPFARPLLSRIRAAFQRHGSFGFWKARLMEDPEGLFARGARASPMGVRVTSSKDLPPRRVLVAYVKQARRLNEEGIKEPRRAGPRGAIRVLTPADLKTALARKPKARRTFEAFPPGARRDHVEWLTEAKRPQTRTRRPATALEWLAEGKRRNWKYERRP